MHKLISHDLTMNSNHTQETLTAATVADTDHRNHECRELLPTQQECQEIKFGEDHDTWQMELSQDQETHMSFMSTNDDNPTADPPMESNDNKAPQPKSRCQEPHLQVTKAHQISMRHPTTKTTKQMTPKETLQTKQQTAFGFHVHSAVKCLFYLPCRVATNL